MIIQTKTSSVIKGQGNISIINLGDKHQSRIVSSEVQGSFIFTTLTGSLFIKPITGLRQKNSLVDASMSNESQRPL